MGDPWFSEVSCHLLASKPPCTVVAAMFGWRECDGQVLGASMTPERTPEKLLHAWKHSFTPGTHAGAYVGLWCQLYSVHEVSGSRYDAIAYF